MKVPLRGPAPDRTASPARTAGSARSARPLALLVAAAALVVGAPGLAGAATAPDAAGAAKAVAPATATTVVSPYAANQLNISMQVQQQDEWCWAASGNTIASYFGHGTDQNSFCDLAIGQSTAYTCPNQAGELSWDQNAFMALGVSPGTETGALSYATIVNEINAGRPMETGISWLAGGGHAQVIYGYDQASQSIYWGDPWPSSNRYNMASYSYYAGYNGQFQWNDTLYRIGA